MKTVDKYLARRFASTTIKAIVGMTLLYILIDLLTNRNAAILRNEVSMDIVFQFYLALTPWIVGQLAPFAVLVSGLMVVGDTAQNNEVVAMMSGGVSLRRFVAAPVVVTVLFTAGLFLLSETVGVQAARTAESLQQSYFSRNPDFDRNPVSWGNLSGGWTCHIAKFNRIAMTGEDVLIHISNENQVEQIEAHRILWDEDSGQWLLEDGRWYRWSEDQFSVSWERITQSPAPFAETPSTLFAAYQEAETKTPGELKDDIQAAESLHMQTATLRVDYQAKFARPAICFVMIWLAISFALRLRRGGLAISFGLGILIGTAYLIVFMVALRFGEVGRMPAMASAWFANVLFFIVGQALFWRTPT